jgi:hypothetical protein
MYYELKGMIITTSGGRLTVCTLKLVIASEWVTIQVMRFNPLPQRLKRE